MRIIALPLGCGDMQVTRQVLGRAGSPRDLHLERVPLLVHRNRWLHGPDTQIVTAKVPSGPITGSKHEVGTH